MAVTGCSNNCTKASENDIGIRGAKEPEWIGSSCCDCGLCLKFCPVQAIERKQIGRGKNKGYRYDIDRESCIGCSVCTMQCPGEAWVVARQGYNLYIGGTMGKIPRFASLLKKQVEGEEELYDLIDKALSCYRKHGRKKERFGHMIDRIGLETVKAEILGESLESRKNGHPQSGS